MPRGDRTGPAGAGPMTGRAAGICTGNAMPAVAQGGWGRGFGMGYGRGGGRGGRRGGGGMRGFGGMNRGPVAVAPLTVEQERANLKQQAASFASALEEIQGQIQKLETNPADSNT